MLSDKYSHFLYTLSYIQISPSHTHAKMTHQPAETLSKRGGGIEEKEEHRAGIGVVECLMGSARPLITEMVVLAMAAKFLSQAHTKLPPAITNRDVILPPCFLGKLLQ